MQWLNDGRSYGGISIALHWLAAIAIVMMLITGFRADFLGDAGDRAARAETMSWHISLGAAFALILLARVIASYAQPRPAPVAQSPLLQSLAGATHHLLLIAILIQVVSGPLAVWSGGRDIQVFDLFALPTPFAERNEGVHELTEAMHAAGRWAILGLLGLHVAAVIRHSFGGRAVMARMLGLTRA